MTPNHIRCDACGDSTDLEPNAAVASAQVAAFVEAHGAHDLVSVRLLVVQAGTRRPQE